MPAPPIVRTVLSGEYASWSINTRFIVSFGVAKLRFIRKSINRGALALGDDDTKRIGTSRHLAANVALSHGGELLNDESVCRSRESAR